MILWSSEEANGRKSKFGDQKLPNARLKDGVIPSIFLFLFCFVIERTNNEQKRQLSTQLKLSTQ